jgi:hypothetical protein
MSFTSTCTNLYIKKIKNSVPMKLFNLELTVTLWEKEIKEKAHRGRTIIELRTNEAEISMGWWG